MIILSVSGLDGLDGLGGSIRSNLCFFGDSSTRISMPINFMEFAMVLIVVKEHFNIAATICILGENLYKFFLALLRFDEGPELKKRALNAFIFVLPGVQ